MKLISACLLGVNCKYNGKNNDNPDLRKRLEDENVILICPEQLGGLPSPRLPSEIVQGDGGDVLEGKSVVLSKSGQDLSSYFIKGAQAALRIAQEQKPDLVILKSRSPSCGVGWIYDGSFASHLRPGNGVAAEVLSRAGYKIISDEDYLGGGGS
ncbi:MAG TPA: DUF523 domain-containing protein [Syntrophomonadaceae bacterium]|nr:DUF523 domain-containing protein [Syntrophomonadaceae bacterium]